MFGTFSDKAYELFLEQATFKYAQDPALQSAKQISKSPSPKNIQPVKDPAEDAPKVLVNPGASLTDKQMAINAIAARTLNGGNLS